MSDSGSISVQAQPPTSGDRGDRSLSGWLRRLLASVLELIAGSRRRTTLKPAQIAALDRQLQAWARAHPERGRRIFGFASGTLLSPLEIADAVHNRTPDGVRFLRLVGQVLRYKDASLDDIIRSFPTEGPYKPEGRELR